MADPISATAAFAFLNSAFKLSEYAIRLYGVDSENGVFVRMIHRVRLDVEEVERLLSVPSVNRKLLSIPAKLKWIKSVVLSAKSALNDIGRWVDRARADKVGYGSVSWENRIRWVFNDHDKLVNRRMELSTSHQALSNVLGYLAPLEEPEAPADAQPPDYEDVTFFDDFLSPRQKRWKARDRETKPGIAEVNEGSSNATTYQSGQASSFGGVAPSIVKRDEAGSGSRIWTSGEGKLPERFTTPSSSTWPSTDGNHTMIKSTVPPTPSSPQSTNVQYSGKTDLTVFRMSTPSQPDIVYHSSQSNFQQTPRSHTAQSYSTNSSKPVEGSACAFSSPPNPMSTSQSFHYSESINSSTSNVFSGATSVHQRSSTIPMPSRHTIPLQSTSIQLSATNLNGPIDPFDFCAELDTSNDWQPNKVSDPYLIAVEQFIPMCTSITPQNLSTSPTEIQNPVQQTNNVAELMGDLIINHSENHTSRANKRPEILSVPTWLTISNDQRNIGLASAQQRSLSIPEIPGDEMNNSGPWSTSAIPAPVKTHCAVERSQNPLPKFVSENTSIYEEKILNTACQSPQAYYETPPPSDSWSSRHQVHAKLQSHNQNQYQSYFPPVSPPTLPSSPVSLNSMVPPSPVPWQEQQQAPVSPLSQLSTPVESTLSSAGQDRGLSRSMTAGEARRRNQRGLLDLMVRGSYG